MSSFFKREANSRIDYVNALTESAVFDMYCDGKLISTERLPIDEEQQGFLREIMLSALAVISLGWDVRSVACMADVLARRMFPGNLDVHCTTGNALNGMESVYKPILAYPAWEAEHSEKVED